MTSSSCPACGAPITWVRDGDRNVALDKHETTSGERVAIRPEGLVSASPSWPGLAYTRHACRGRQ